MRTPTHYRRGYARGFMNKMASAGVSEQMAVRMLKTAYELGSDSPDYYGVTRMPTPDWKSFAKEDPRPWGLDFFSNAHHRRVVENNLPKPKSTEEQIKDYEAVADRFKDGLIRRVPIVEDGQYNSTYVKDFNDLANLQSDAIRRRRGVGGNLIWIPKIRRYRIPDENKIQ